MIRKIIKIDKETCNGCGLCVNACHEGAIELIDGKAVLAKEDHCDGLGDCLPGCPTGAISFELREAPAYDEAAVLASKAKNDPLPCGCAGSQVRALERKSCDCHAEVPSQLRQWPVQIKLVPVSAPWFKDSDVLIAADCTAYAYGNFHQDFIRDRVVLVGCPKLDEGDYAQKLTAIFSGNDIRSVTLTRMLVPCCGGMERAVGQAIDASGKAIPLRVVTIGPEGDILRDTADGHRTQADENCSAR